MYIIYFVWGLLFIGYLTDGDFRFMLHILLGLLLLVGIPFLIIMNLLG